MISERNIFANRAELAAALSLKTARVLSRAITMRGNALLAVSGGTTPVLFFEHLSQIPIAWEKIAVTLVDERQVPEESPRSNARLVREHLQRNDARKAQFIPLYQNPAAEKLSEFDATILGMGNDGHTASFFPGGDTLAEAIDPNTKRHIIEISAPGSGEPRITFTLPRLVRTTFLALHIEGREKLAILDKALAGDDQHAMPIRAILKSQTPLILYWCP
jgi:6-phosphogluconolactonase